MFNRSILLVLAALTLAGCAGREPAPKYRTVCAGAREDLSSFVQSWLRRDYRLQGGVSVSIDSQGNHTYCQAILKED